MGDHILQTLLLSKAVDLERALALMLDAEARQKTLKSQHPQLYDAAFHAAGIAQHIQGIYTQIEALLKQAIEQTDRELPNRETWHQDLFHFASTATHHRDPLLDAPGASSLKELLCFRHIAQSTYAGELDPPRVFLQIANTIAAVQATVTGVRQPFEPSDAPSDVTSNETRESQMALQRIRSATNAPS